MRNRNARIFRHEFSFAIRHILRRPGVPLLVILSLTIAQGVNIGMFSIVNSIWLAPWPVPRASSIRVVEPSIPEMVCRGLGSRVHSFSQLACVGSGPFLQLNGRPVSVDFVTANYFGLMGAAPAIGAGFGDSDDSAPATAGKVVISDRVWRAYFAADRNILGKVLTLNPADRDLRAVSFTVIGVAPPGFEGADGLRKQLWLPLSAVGQFEPDALKRKPPVRMVKAFGRLSADDAGEGAQAEVVTAINNLNTEHQLPDSQRGPITVTTTDLYSRYALSLQARLAIASLVIGVAFVTFVGCANILNLLLARGHSRRSEIAIRFAMGATRGEVIRLLLTESFILAMIGSILGLMIAVWLPELTLRALLQSATPELADLVRTNFPVDHRVYLWALLMSLAACACFGTLPALRSSEARPIDMLKEVQATSRDGYMSSFLGLQTIVSVMAITVGGLILSSGSALDARAWTSAMRGLTVVRLSLPDGADHDTRALLTRLTEDRLVTLAGRQNVGGVGLRSQADGVQLVPVTPEYFTTLSLKLVSGRPILHSDVVDDVMVVNDAFARRYSVSVAPLDHANGKVATISVPDLTHRRVVGIVGDAQTRATVYLPMSATDTATFIVRSPSSRVLQDVPAFLARHESSVTVHVSRASEADGAPGGSSLLAAYAVIAFGALFLLMGAVGFCGLLDYSIRQRTREVGIRMAIGAREIDVMRAILAPTGWTIARSLLIGEVSGMIVGLLLKRGEAPTGIDPLNPIVYFAVTVALSIIGLLAAFPPLRRAVRIPVTEALRH